MRCAQAVSACVSAANDYLVFSIRENIQRYIEFIAMAAFVLLR